MIEGSCNYLTHVYNLPKVGEPEHFTMSRGPCSCVLEAYSPGRNLQTVTNPAMHTELINTQIFLHVQEMSEAYTVSWFYAGENSNAENL